MLSSYIQQSGKSTKRISKLSKIPEQRVSEIANGADPSLQELRQIARVLGVSVSDLTYGDGRTESLPMLFRSTMGELTPSEAPVVQRLSAQLEHALELVPRSDRPEWLGLFDGPHEYYTDAERDATLFRSILFGNDHVSPLLRLPQLVADETGVLLLVAGHHKIDGASAMIEGLPFILISPCIPARMLFTLAHELGHIVAHHGADSDFAVFDRELGTGKDPRRSALQERFANAFASCLLLPSAGIGGALRTIRKLSRVSGDAIGDVEILYLARIFGVSFQVAARRCEDLSLLPRGGAVSLYKELCSNYGGPEKRAEQVQLPPRPDIFFPAVSSMLVRAAIEKIRRGDVSIGRAAAILSMSIPALVDAHRNLVA